MKSTNVVMYVLAAAFVLAAAGATRPSAQAKIPSAPAKIGVMNLNQVLQGSKKHKAWQEKMNEEEKTIKAELDKLRSELDFINKDLKTLKEGSPDYTKLMRELAEKDGVAAAKEKYYEQEMTYKVKAWTEALYQDIVARVADVAKKNGLDIVLSSEEVEIPSLSMRELLLDIKTNKVLYRSDSLDITSEVLAALDAGQ